MSNLMKIREKVVGAKGFEPSTCWSRNRVPETLKALSGVAYVNDRASFLLSVVRKLYLDRTRWFEVTP
jgi:hypothetical protein